MKLHKLKPFYSSNEKSIVWITILLFLALRVFFVFAFGNLDKSTFLDASGYNEYAKTILTGTDWLTHHSFPGSMREPFYPFVVALIYALFGKESFLAVYLIQALIGSLMLLIIYRIANLTIKSKLVAYLSLLWAGFYIFYLRWVGELLRETIVYFLLAYFVLLLINYFIGERRKFVHLLWMSVTYSALFHTDGRYLFYAPFLVIPFLLYLRPLKYAISHYAMFGITVVFLTVPWSFRNYLAYEDVIVVSYYTLNLTSDELSERGELFDLSEITEAAPSLHFNRYNDSYPLRAERDSIQEGYNPRNRGEMELRALRKGKEASTSFIGRKWYFFRKMWSPVNFGGQYAPFPMAYFEEGYSTGHNVISLLQYGVLLPFAFIGAVSIFSRRMKPAYLMIFVLLLHMLLHLVTFGIERYRHPVDALIIIVSLFGAKLCLDWARKHHTLDLSILHDYDT